MMLTKLAIFVNEGVKNMTRMVSVGTICASMVISSFALGACAPDPVPRTNLDVLSDLLDPPIRSIVALPEQIPYNWHVFLLDAGEADTSDNKISGCLFAGIGPRTDTFHLCRLIGFSTAPLILEIEANIVSGPCASQLESTIIPDGNPSLILSDDLQLTHRVRGSESFSTH